MKKTIIITTLILLLLPVLCLAGPLQKKQMAVIANKNVSGYTFSCTDADLVCEDYDYTSDCGNDAAGATNCRVTHVVDETYATITFAKSGSACAGKGSYVAGLEDTSADGVPNVYIDGGAGHSVWYIQIYFRLLNDLSSNTRASYIVWGDTSTSFSNIAFELQFVRVSAGNYKVCTYHYNRTGYELNCSTKTDFQLNTWYGGRLFYDDDVSEGIGIAAYHQPDVTTDSWTQIAITTPLTPARTARYLAVQPNGIAVETNDLDIDMLKADTSGFPASSCP